MAGASRAAPRRTSSTGVQSPRLRVTFLSRRDLRDGRRERPLAFLGLGDLIRDLKRGAKGANLGRKSPGFNALPGACLSPSPTGRLQDAGLRERLESTLRRAKAFVSKVTTPKRLACIAEGLLL